MTEQDQPHGILIVDKPEGMTSHDVVARVRRILKTKRVGHTGTLDPFATGVLVLLVGKTTRLAQFIDKDEKEYEATLKLGFETDTGDKTGVRTDDSGLAEDEIAKRLADVHWDDALAEFRGEIEQVPPMYSAKKVAGKKLYELARAGKEIQRKPVKINITELEMINENQASDMNTGIRIRVVCSAGTYIRALAEDIGRNIDIGAHLKALRRTRAGQFTLDGSVTLDLLESAQDMTPYLRPIEDVVSHLTEFQLDPSRIEKTKNGLSTRVMEGKYKDGQFLRMTDISGNVIAVGVFNESENSIKPTVVLV